VRWLELRKEAIKAIVRSMDQANQVGSSRRSSSRSSSSSSSSGSNGSGKSSVHVFLAME